MHSTNKKLPLAICGIGHFVTKRVIPAISMCQNVELVAVVDISTEVGPLSPNIHRFKSLEELLASGKAYAVYIATPNYLHAQQTMQCLAAGRHVLCEKPMATNSIDCQNMVTAAQNQKLHLKIGHMLRYSPAIQLARSWLRKGMAGEPCAISTLFHYDLPEKNRQWAFQQDVAGGGALMDAGIHCIDTIRFLAGDPVIPLGAMTEQIPEGSVERNAVCRFMAAGVVCFVQVSSQAPYCSRLSISGTDGEIVIDNFAACWGTAIVKLFPSQSGRVVKEETIDVSKTYSEQIRNFADEIYRSEFDSTAALDSAENVRIVEQLYTINNINDHFGLLAKEK